MAKGLRIAAALCALAGLASLGWGLWLFRQESAFLATARRALGKVVETQTSPVDETTNRYCPIVEFSDEGGTVASFVDLDCDTAVVHRKGDVVPVLYRRADPGHARIDVGATALSAAATPIAWALAAFLLAAGAAFAAGRLGRTAARDG